MEVLKNQPRRRSIKIMENITTDKITLLSDLVENSKRFSMSTVSNYRVGAVCEGNSGKLYIGSNIEIGKGSIVYSLHAEQAAINNAWLNGETGITILATSSMPCGCCRQFVKEINYSDKIILYCCSSGQMLTMNEALPYGFGPADLGLKSKFMINNEATYLNDDVELEALAVAAASCSYAPYSKSYSGIALQTSKGVRITGRYAENAAFNPSILPALSALSAAILNNIPASEINRVVLAEVYNAKFSQEEITKSILNILCNASIETVLFDPALHNY